MDNYGRGLRLADFSRTLSDDRHLVQSIMLILMTRKGERVMRPWFGSRLYMYIDEPINQKTLAAMRYAIYEALRDEEPRVMVKTIKAAEGSHKGSLIFEIIGETDMGAEAAVRLIYDRDMKKWQEMASVQGGAG